MYLDSQQTTITVCRFDDILFVQFLSLTNSTVVALGQTKEVKIFNSWQSTAHM